MIPNKTEEQILNQYFKYYDIDDTGFTNLQNFIKTNEKLGVSLQKISDFEKIFNYFDRSKKGIINYKDFIKEIFSIKNFNENPNIHFEKKDFVLFLNNHLLEKGGNLQLINFIKALQIIDYNDSMRMSIDDFLKVLNESHLDLNSKEIQYLYQEYEYFSNGVVYYKKMIDKLFDKFYNKKRDIFAENLYENLTNDEHDKISLNDIREIYRNNSNNYSRNEFFMRFIDEYKFITRGSIDKPMSLSDIKKFIKCIGYGIESDNELRSLLFELNQKKNYNTYENKNNNYNFNNNNNYYNNNYQYSYINNNENYNKNKIDKMIFKLKQNLIKYGRKTFFNFIKHFKYYDNNTKKISKYDFVKVLKDFNLLIPLIDVENIFQEFSTDEKKLFIDYNYFLKEISKNTINDIRENEIGKIFNIIINKANEIQKPITINLLKEFYCPKNNYFINDENQNKIEFEECLDLFHYIYKGFNNDTFTENEFFEFYYFISFLIENDENFNSLLNNEWKFNDENKNNFNFTFGKYNQISKPQINQPIEENRFYNKNDFTNLDKIQLLNKQLDNYSNNNNNLKNNQINKIVNSYQRKENKNRTFNNINDNTIEKIRQKLKARGLRGLLYLHRQFILSCPNINKISFNQFKNILLGQHIILNDSEYSEIYYKYYNNNTFLLSLFIREFKKKLNEDKLYYVENAYSILDRNGNEKVPIEYINKCYDAKNHPDVLSGKKNEEEQLLEFIECFEINFNLLNEENNNNNIVDFEIFANFYEYVAFIYNNTKQFGIIIQSTFH